MEEIQTLLTQAQGLGVRLEGFAKSIEAQIDEKQLNFFESVCEALMQTLNELDESVECFEEEVVTNLKPRHRSKRRKYKDPDKALCLVLNCNKKPTFCWPPEAKVCMEHKMQGMIKATESNQKVAVCEHNGCQKEPLFNKKKESNG
mmetsp:Transcript_42083/g.72485  ORF Transcript_42083/g.72485 Transcript_42083/m.72485 type:complete len:146 (+) Transcript_42083:6-443(+)